MTLRALRRAEVGIASAAVAVLAAGLATLAAGPVTLAAGPVTLAAAPDSDRQHLLSPEGFGAAGDGVTDDTAALQAALDALGDGHTLKLTADRVYRHDDVLRVRRAGAQVIGPGTLLAGREESSSLQLQAARIRLAHVTLSITDTTKRWVAFEQHRLVLGPYAGLVVEDVRVEGSAGAGVYVGGASRFRLDDLVVLRTRADAVHITGGAHDGLVRRPHVYGSGDDGIAVVSYQGDESVSRDIVVESPRVLGTTWGRGISVVGGEDVTYRDVVVEGSSAAAVYVATEGAPYFTRATRRVQVLGARLARANHDARVDHGAVLVSAAGRPVSHVTLRDVAISGTRPGAARQVGVLGESTLVEHVLLAGFRVTGGGSLFQSTAGSSSYRTQDWTVDGRAVVSPG